MRWWREVVAALAVVAAVASACFACDANHISREANQNSRDALAEARRANEIADEDRQQSAAIPKVDSSAAITGDCGSGDAIKIGVTLRNDGRLSTNANGIELVVDYERETKSGEYALSKLQYKDEVLTATPLEVEVPGQGSKSVPLVVACDKLGFLVAGVIGNSSSQLVDFIEGAAVTVGALSSPWTVEGSMYVKVDFGKGGPTKVRLTTAKIR
jgi:hypothetical protein